MPMTPPLTIASAIAWVRLCCRARLRAAKRVFWNHSESMGCRTMSRLLMMAGRPRKLKECFLAADFDYRAAFPEAWAG